MTYLYDFDTNSCIGNLQPEVVTCDIDLPPKDVLEDIDDVSIEQLQKDLRKLERDMTSELERDMTSEILVPSVTIPGEWTMEFLRNLDMASHEFKEIENQARNSAKGLFSCKSALRDFNEAEFHDIDDCTASLIAEFVNEQTKLNSKSKLRMCELLTQLLGMYTEL